MRISTAISPRSRRTIRMVRQARRSIRTPRPRTTVIFFPKKSTRQIPSMTGASTTTTTGRTGEMKISRSASRITRRSAAAGTVRRSTRTASLSGVPSHRARRAARPASTPSTNRTSASAGGTKTATTARRGRPSAARSSRSKARIIFFSSQKKSGGSTARRRKPSRSMSQRTCETACRTCSTSSTSPSVSALRGTNIFSCRTLSSSRRAVCGRQSR